MNNRGCLINSKKSETELSEWEDWQNLNATSNDSDYKNSENRKIQQIQI
jgi:hypothetical protein